MADEPKPKSELVLYQTKDGRTRVEVRLESETVWLSLNQMADLFQRDKSVISKHIKNVFEAGELKADSVVANFATTAGDGKTYQVDYYNLDVIISVGYRVKSLRGTQFRIWATQRLREYIVKGFTLDDQRLKGAGGGRYFEELLAHHIIDNAHSFQRPVEGVTKGTGLIAGVDLFGQGQLFGAPEQELLGREPLRRLRGGSVDDAHDHEQVGVNIQTQFDGLGLVSRHRCRGIGLRWGLFFAICF